MALKLNSREIPLVNFRRVLPAFLGPDGEECFIEVDARAGGAVNQPYLHAAEKLLLTARVMDRKNGKIEDDKKAVQAQFDATRDVTRRRFGVIYDACVIEWRSNILDGGDPIKCDRENFIELTEAKVPEISAAMTDLEREILEAGKIVLDETEGLEKN